MKAMVLRKCAPVEDKPLLLEDRPEPMPGQGEVRVKVEVCGVCRTDLHIIEGDLPPPKFPRIPGHQIVGRIDKFGAGVQKFKEGDLVGVAWLHRTCGQCRFCKRGNENLCESAQFTGYTTDGGYAEYAVAPADFVYAIPTGFLPELAAPLLCAGLIGYRALNLSGVRNGERLGLYGFGASAHLVLQIAVSRGCDVYVFTRSEAHRKLAAKLGAAWTGEAGQPPPHKPDASILFAPHGKLVPVALGDLQKGGTLAIADIYMSAIPELNYEKHLFGERVLRSVTAATRRDAEELLQIAAQIPLRPEVQLFPLEEANSALLALKTSKINGAGVLQVAR